VVGAYFEVELLRSSAPGGPVTARRDVVVVLVEERDRVPLREKKRRVDAERLGGTKVFVGGDSVGEFGPRRTLRRWSAVAHSVHGCVCDSAKCPQPLCWVWLWKHMPACTNNSLADGDDDVA
jgi:hypothetical protein